MPGLLDGVCDRLSSPFLGPCGVLEGEDAGVLPREVLLRVPGARAPAAQAPELAKARARRYVSGRVDLQRKRALTP